MQIGKSIIAKLKFKSDSQSSLLLKSEKSEMSFPLNLQARSIGGRIASQYAGKIVDQSKIADHGKAVLFSAFDLQVPPQLKKEQQLKPAASASIAPEKP